MGQLELLENFLKEFDKKLGKEIDVEEFIKMFKVRNLFITQKIIEFEGNPPEK